MNIFQNTSSVSLLAFILMGCANTNDPSGEFAPKTVSERALLSYFQIGKTRKAEILHQWGNPAAQFENGRILSYRLMKPYSKENPQDWIVVSPVADTYHKGFTQWGPSEYNLIIVLDSAKVLQNYSLIKLTD